MVAGDGSWKRLTSQTAPLTRKIQKVYHKCILTHKIQIPTKSKTFNTHVYSSTKSAYPHCLPKFHQICMLILKIQNCISSLQKLTHISSLHWLNSPHPKKLDGPGSSLLWVCDYIWYGWSCFRKKQKIVRWISLQSVFSKWTLHPFSVMNRLYGRKWPIWVRNSNITCQRYLL